MPIGCVEKGETEEKGQWTSGPPRHVLPVFQINLETGTHLDNQTAFRFDVHFRLRLALPSWQPAPNIKPMVSTTPCWIYVLNGPKSEFMISTAKFLLITHYKPKNLPGLSGSVVDYPIRTHFHNWALPLSGFGSFGHCDSQFRPLDFAGTLTRRNPGSGVAGGPWRQLPEKGVNLLQQKSATLELDVDFGGIDNVEKPEKSWGNIIQLPASKHCSIFFGGTP